MQGKPQRLTERCRVRRPEAAFPIIRGFMEKARFELSTEYGQNLNRRHRAKGTPSRRNGMNQGMEEKKDEGIWRRASDPFWLERRSIFPAGKQ